MFIRVDLPEPEAPMIAMNSPRSMVKLIAAQRAHLEVAKLIGLVEIGNVYDNVWHDVACAIRTGSNQKWCNPPIPGCVRCGRLPVAIAVLSSITTWSPGFRAPLTIWTEVPSSRPLAT